MTPQASFTFATEMLPIDIPGTEKTPSILFDPTEGVLELKGISIPENAERFYRPLIEKLEIYTKDPAKRTTIKIIMRYFNSSSAKYILDLLRVLDEAHVAGIGEVVLEWYHDADDLDMEETGNDYKTLLDMPVNLMVR